MALIKRSEVTVPALPSAEMPFPLLGGDVLVQGLRLTERLQLRQDLRDKPAMAFIPALLARSVVDAEGQPLASAEEWEVLGAQAPGEVGAIYARAYELGGFDLEAERKN